MNDLTQYKAATFDCFGTLIDWSSGIRRAARAVLDEHGIEMSPEQIIDRYIAHERDAERGAYQTYREILAAFIGSVAPRSTQQQRQSLPESIAAWEAFPDTIEGLTLLARHYRLAVVSNIDDDLFEGANARLGRPFEHVVTAQQVSGYKPGEAHFVEVSRRLALEPREILHVASSRFHDVAPASRLGFGTVWVNRGDAASGPGEAEADLTVATVGELGELVASAFAGNAEGA